MTGKREVRREAFLAGVLLAYGLARGGRAVVRRLGFSAPGHPPGPDPWTEDKPVPGRFLRDGLIAIVLVAIVIAATGWLGAATTKRVNTFNPRWWGAPQESAWPDAAKGITLLSRGLAIAVNGDQLTATYTVTTAPDSPAVRTAENDANGDPGNDLVDSLLGDVQVGEFHYGITGHQLTMVPVSFKAPHLQVKPGADKRPVATIVVESLPFRLYRHRQQITVLPPGNPAGKSPDMLVQVTAPGAQVASPVNITVANVADGVAGSDSMANLRIKPDSTGGDLGNPSFMLSEGDASPGWLDGLRAVGGMTFPVVDGFIFRIGVDIFVYAVLLWAFYRARRAFPGDPLVRMGLRTVQVIVAAKVAVAVLVLAYDVSWKLDLNGADDRDYLFAGPLGLLVGGAVVIWPVVCWRGGSSRDSPGPAPARSRRGVLLLVLAVLAMLAVACLYWLRLGRLGIDAFTSVPVIAGTVVVITAVPLLTRRLIGGHPAGVTWAASAGLTAVILATTASWPLLFYEAYSGNINKWGKWTYVAAVLALTAGLCLMWGRITWAVLRDRQHRFRPDHRHRLIRALPVLVVGVVVAGIGAVILPDAVSESGVASPHATGLLPHELVVLADDLPQMLDWLLLGLTIVVIMRLPSWPDPRPVARDLALPVALLLFYWVNWWLDLPITGIAGVLLIRWLVMPRRLAEETLPGEDPENQVREAAAGWRRADLVAGQQQALAASGSEKLRGSMLSGKADEFQRQVERLTRAHDELVGRRDEHRRDARKAKAKAFSHRGAALNRGFASDGAITGAVVGLIPAAVTLLTTQPPDAGGSYPVLSFLGNTAWTLLTWAGLGWFIGYFLPLINGGNGVTKAMWIFIAWVGGSLPNNLIWNDARDWVNTLVAELLSGVFLAVVTVIVCDLRTLRRAEMPMTDWVRVHNWRIVATWSTALLAAVGTIAITFATATITDLSQQLTGGRPPSTTQSAPPAKH